MAAEKRVVFRSAWLPWVLIAPQAAVILVFFFWPAGQTVLQSLQQQDAFGTSTEWVGFANFQRIFSDPSYLASFRTTAVFSILVAVIGIVLALVLAVYADRVIKAAIVYKTLLIWPYAVAPAVAGALWLFMFAPSVGVVSYALRHFGIQWNHLLDANDAMAIIVMAAVWNQLSYNFLFFLAGLQSIPKSLLEAAAIDGARPWRRFWTIVFPLLSPTTFFLLVINVIYAFFGTFGIIDAATEGGPGKETAVLVYKLYFDGFKALDLGGSAAQSVVLMVIVITLTVVQFRFVESRVNY
ncbi:MAG TPA: sn-glycerol-3-phosphate ABC transporter permease UgpA [Caldimonas sp.]